MMHLIITLIYPMSSVKSIELLRKKMKIRTLTRNGYKALFQLTKM